MKHNQKGFTLVELMITMAVFLIVMVMAGNIFSTLLGQFKQQSRIAESNIEGNIGLQILRRDIEQAGYGLPWDLNGATYTEAGQISSPISTPWTDRWLNDGPPYDTVANGQPTRGADANTGTSANPPGAIRSGNAYNSAMPAGCSTNPANANHCSDVLVLKAVNIGTNDTVQKWTYVYNTGGSTNIPGPMPTLAAEQFDLDERVIIIRPDLGNAQRLLMTDSAGHFYTHFKTSGAYPTKVYDMATFRDDTSVATNSELLPEADSLMTHIIYGISPATTNPRMPFNRADYYVRRPATGMPSKCEPSTGILYKAVLSNNSDSSIDDTSTPVHGSKVTSELPLLDCVADMQLVFGLDTDDDGIIDSSTQDLLNTLTAEDVRNQLREVRVYIIAHEGQLDTTYTYTNPYGTDIAGCTGADKVCINDVGGIGLIKAFTVPNRNYRWKLYTMITTPSSVR